MNRRNQLLKNETQRYAVLGALFGLLFPIGATLIRIATSDLPFGFQSVAYIQSTDSLLWIIDTAPLFLGLFAAIAGRRQDNLQQVNAELSHREHELIAMQLTLEQRVEQRTLELSIANQNAEKRAGQLQTIAETARVIISVQNIDKLLPLIAQVISNRFGFYHVGIFLLDEQNQYAFLYASNSEGGLRMLQRSHRLKVGEQGVVGFVAQSGRARIALDVGRDAAFFNNPDLPDTRSEMALPLKSGNRIIGVLDIQSTEANAFVDDDIETLSVLADQVAVAIQNSLLYEQSQRALQEAEIASSQLSKDAWKQYAEKIRTRGYRYDGIKSEALKEASKSHREIESLSIPVRLRGQTIGRLRLKPSDTTRQWTEDEMAIMEAAAERVALAVDGARLLEDAQKRAARETFLSEMTAKLGTTFQLDSILRDTVEELGQTLKNSTISFQLVNPSTPPSAPSQKSDDTSMHRKKPE
jgi:GAF domain-containing protein